MSLSASKENIALARSCCRRFEFSDRVEILDAARYNVGLEEAKMIGAVVQNHATYSKLRCLLLRYNKLGDEGIIHLAGCLRVNKSLQVMSVGQNQFTDKGLTVLSRSIRYHPSLKSLDVAKNETTVEGLTDFCEAVSMNTTLEWVCVNVYMLPVQRLRGSAKPYVQNGDYEEQDAKSSRTLFRVGPGAFKGASGLDAPIIEVYDLVAIADTRLDEVIDAASSEAEGDVDDLSQKPSGRTSDTTLPPLTPAAGGEPALLEASASNLNSDAAEESGTGDYLNLSELFLNYADGLLTSHLITDNRHVDSIRLSGTPLPLCRLDNLRTDVTQMTTLSMKSANLLCADVCVLAKVLETNNATLKWLDLSENEIGSNGAWVLGSAIMSNRGLTYVNLSTNKLTDTGCNEEGVVRIAHALDVNSTLRTLKLRHNHIGVPGAIGFGEVLHGDDGLLTLDLTDNLFGDDEGGDALIRGLTHNETLTSLNDICLSQEGEKPRAWGLKRFKDISVPEYSANLMHHQSDGFQLFEAAFVAHRLKLSQTVTLLNLSRNFLGAAHLRLIADALPGQPTLLTLDISHNRLTGVYIDQHGIEHGSYDGQGVEALAKVLSETRNKRKIVLLQSLDMRWSGIRDPRKKLADAMQRNKSITALNGMELRCDTTELIVDHRTGGLEPYESSFIGARITEGAGELDILSIRHNRIVGLRTDGTGLYDTYGGVAIARGLAANNNLATLDFSENMLGPIVSAALFEALETNPNVEMFRMAKNDIQGVEYMRAMHVDKVDNSGVYALVRMVERNSRITTLDLSDNRLDETSATLLSEAVNKNIALDVLVLSGNEFGNTGAHAIAKMIASNTTLATLDIHSCNLTHSGDVNDGVIHIANSLKLNKRLCNLDISGNDLDFDDDMSNLEAIIAIGECLHSNETLLDIDVTHRDAC
jgi:Ran GTPase-activating protein (RanGAP) involved in mRNA processing and transport